ncbi:hypothetical protein V6M85_01595 [Sulfolobus tengchongensis]|uniref:Uncharacterized protein n=1 Tax=Sulfolobus tengchongensis TaxID=207809 RepID=A0AAX4L3M2_9CREN
MLNLKVLRVRQQNKIYTNCELTINSFSINVDCYRKRIMGPATRINVLNYTFDRNFSPQFDNDKLIVNDVIVFLKDQNDIRLINDEIRSEILGLLKQELIEPVTTIAKERIKGLKLIDEYNAKPDLSILLESKDPTSSISDSINKNILRIEEVLKGYNNDVVQVYKDRIFGLVYLLSKILEYMIENDDTNARKAKELLANLLNIPLSELEKILYNAIYNVDSIVEILLNYALR